MYVGVPTGQIDAVGQPIMPDSWEWSVTYDGAGNIDYEEITSPTGKIWRRTYSYNATPAVTGRSFWTRQN